MKEVLSSPAFIAIDYVDEFVNNSKTRKGYLNKTLILGNKTESDENRVYAIKQINIKDI